jgi:hypothetical protein
MKSNLILKASKDICSNEIGLIGNHCQLLGMDVYPEEVFLEETLSAIVDMLSFKFKRIKKASPKLPS